MSYEEIRIKIIRATQNLRNRGYRSNEVFAVLANNSHNVAPIAFATMANGSAVNTLDPSFGKTELLHMFSTIKPALVFCDVETYELAQKCLIELKNDAKIFTFGGSTGTSEDVENLFVETHDEENFL